MGDKEGAGVRTGPEVTLQWVLLRARGQGTRLKGALRRGPLNQHLWVWLGGWMLGRKYFKERADQGWINVLLWGRTLPQSTWASGSRLTPTLSLHGGSGGWALSSPRPAPPSPVPPPKGKRGPSSSFFPRPAPGSLAARSDRSRLDPPSPPLCHSFMHTLCLPPPVWAEREGQGLAP